VRLATFLCLVFLFGCDDELRYIDGTTWEPVEERDVALLKNDALRLNPYLRNMPKNDREWTRFVQTLNAQPVANLGNVVETFTPATWTGFSADPSGDVSYLDLGAVVIMWRDTALTGTSDDTGMTFTGIPEEIRPVSGNKTVRCLVINDSFTLGGAVEITTTGIAQFYLEDVAGGGAGTSDDDKVTPQGTGFANTGTKGIPAGFIVMFSTT
jgi:hypothetical protein